MHAATAPSPSPNSAVQVIASRFNSGVRPDQQHENQDFSRAPIDNLRE
jgi:hypothetical protein